MMRRLPLYTLSCILFAASGTLAGAQEAPAAAAPDTAEGRRVFESVCAACHSLVPPAKLAPPMSHVARHYREAYPERDAFVERVVSFVRAPSVEASVMPAHARERFGLMTPMPLPEAQLRAVAAYVWTLEAPMPGRGSAGRGGPPGR